MAGPARVVSLPPRKKTLMSAVVRTLGTVANPHLLSAFCGAVVASGREQEHVLSHGLARWVSRRHGPLWAFPP